MNPNAVSQIYDSDLVSTLDLDLPQKQMNKIFLKHGNQGIAYLLIRSLGFESPVENDTYYHYEKEATHDTITQSTTVGDVTQAGAGLDITISLDASNLDSSNRYYPRVGDNVMTNNEIVGWIRDITVTAGGLGGGVDLVELTCRPNDEADAWGTISSGEEIIIYSGTFSEGSGMPDEAASGTWQYVNDAKIIKENVGATGTQLVTATWIAQYNEAGEFQGYYSSAYFDLDYRTLTKIDGAFWFDKRISTTAGRAIDPATGYPVKGTEGFVPAIRRLGNINTYTPGSFTVDKFDEYDRTLEREWVDSSIPVWTPMGLYLYQEVENTLKDYFNDTNIVYAKQVTNDMLFKSDESLGASVNFKYLQKSGRTYLFHKLSGFSNQKTYGATGFDMQRMGFIVPLEKRKDPKSGNDIPTIGMRHRSMGKYNRKFIVAKIAGVGASGDSQPITTIDKTNTYMFTHCGTEFYGMNRNILIDNS